MKFKSDIDIDFADRAAALAHLDHVPASQLKNGELVRHNTGVYVTDIPVNPFTGSAALDYETAEDRGYVKIDFLNVNLYQRVRDEQHLMELISQEPDWSRLQDREFFEQLIHVGSHYDTMLRMPEPIDSIPRMMMFLAIIRPAKRHLIGKPWREVAETIWERPTDDSYYFKKAHACAYAHLVVINMNL